MTPRQRVLAALRGEPVDFIPFTIYEWMLPKGAVERQLRNDGVCLIRGPAVSRCESPNVKTQVISYTEKGEDFQRTVITTPVGELTRINRILPFTQWTVKFPFSGPEDYKALLYMIRDTQYFADYDPYRKEEKVVGDDILLRPSIGYCPMQHIIYRSMGLEQFSIEWAENRDEVMKLYDALTEERRRVYEICALSPAPLFNYGGNVSADVIGLDRFRKYLVPHYEEFSEILHAHGKMMGVHFDANTRALAEDIAKTKMDYIEAFTPAPDTDMTFLEARTIWKDKALWINYPSSVHLRPVDQVAQIMRDILRDAGDGRRFLVGITEDVPEDRWKQNYRAIIDVLRSTGNGPRRKA